ncbi:hypothetical protein ACFL0O_00315 [Thermodesulfobacteriota bacterium]
MKVMPFPLLGQMVYNRTFVLSRKVNTELLEPISAWLDDPDFMDRFKVTESEKPDWAEYKRKQREYDLRKAWEAIRLKRLKRKRLSGYQSYVAGLIPRGKATNIHLHIAGKDCLTPILEPFSPPEQLKRETAQDFRQALSLAVSNLLPWNLLITQHLYGPRKLVELPVHYQENPRKDKAAKLQHLLQMEQEGKVTLQQTEPFQDIYITPVDIDLNQRIKLKDQQGRSYEFDWQAFSDNQRNKIIADLKDNKILCKVM